MAKYVPEVKGILRKHVVEVPQVIREASGISIFGKRLKSFLFSTDVAIIKNTNADAVIAVYPFTPQPIITEAILLSADIPVLCGVGGAISPGKRVVNLAHDAEFKGALGVVLNSPVSNEVITKIKNTVDIPVVVSVVSEDEDIEARVKAGAAIFNVSGAEKTVDIVKKIRSKFPEIPIIATGGPNDDSILKTIRAGANAITYTPPTTGEILSKIMTYYRHES